MKKIIFLLFLFSLANFLLLSYAYAAPEPRRDQGRTPTLSQPSGSQKKDRRGTPTSSQQSGSQKKDKGGSQTSSQPSLPGSRKIKLLGGRELGGIECEKDPCTVQDLINAIPAFMRFLIFISFWGALMISVIGAFLWMFGGPFPNLAQTGKNMIKTSIIGFILVVSATAIFLAVLDIFSPKLRYPQN